MKSCLSYIIRSMELDSGSWFSETRICCFGIVLAFAHIHKVATPRYHVHIRAVREGRTAISSSLDQKNKSLAEYSPPQQLMPASISLVRTVAHDRF